MKVVGNLFPLIFLLNAILIDSKQESSSCGFGTKECVQGDCISPDNCICLDGYIPTANASICIPYCENCDPLKYFCYEPNKCVHLKFENNTDITGQQLSISLDTKSSTLESKDNSKNESIIGSNTKEPISESGANSTQVSTISPKSKDPTQENEDISTPGTIIGSYNKGPILKNGGISTQSTILGYSTKKSTSESLGTSTPVTNITPKSRDPTQENEDISTQRTAESNDPTQENEGISTRDTILDSNPKEPTLKNEDYSPIGTNNSTDPNVTISENGGFSTKGTTRSSESEKSILESSINVIERTYESLDTKVRNVQHRANLVQSTTTIKNVMERTTNKVLQSIHQITRQDSASTYNQKLRIALMPFGIGLLIIIAVIVVLVKRPCRNQRTYRFWD